MQRHGGHALITVKTKAERVRLTRSVPPSFMAKSVRLLCLPRTKTRRNWREERAPGCLSPDCNRRRRRLACTKLLRKARDKGTQNTG